MTSETAAGEPKPLTSVTIERRSLPAGSRLYRGGDPIDDPPVATRIVIHVTEPDEMPSNPPCLLGQHRWAWLSAGGQACGVCGRPR